MYFFIFTKCTPSIFSLHKIAENENDLNNQNIIKSDYLIIEDSQENFNDFKYGLKKVDGVNNNTIIFSNNQISYLNKEKLQKEIDIYGYNIGNFLDNNPNHLLFQRWSDYKNQLINLNLDTITYPLNKSLEQYFNDLGQPSYNILQLP
jgi:hypothetical protein